MENEIFSFRNLLNWYKLTFENIFENIFFWVTFYIAYFFVFSLSSNILYQFSITCISFYYCIYFLRYFYSGNKEIISKDFLIRNIFFTIFYLFGCFLTAYILYLMTDYSREHEMNIIFVLNSFAYTNPWDFINSNLVQNNIDLFIYNAFYFPFYIAQIISIALFFVLILFVYPLFVIKKHTLIYSLKKSIHLQFKNVFICFTLIILFCLTALLAYIWPEIIFPFGVLLFWGPIYFMWAQIIGDKKRIKKPIISKEIEKQENLNINIKG